MNMNLILAIAIGLPMVLSLIVSARSRRPHSIRDYFQADGSLSSNLVANLLVSTSLTVGNGLIYFIWLGYKVGWSALSIQLVWCIGYLFFMSGSHRVREKFPNGTLHTALRNFGYPLFLASCFISLLGLCLNAGWEIFALLGVFGDFKGNFAVQITMALMFAVIVGTYTAMGGIRGNAYANLLQNCVSLAAFVGLPIYLAWFPLINVQVPASSSTTISLLDFLGLAGLVGTLLNSLIWQYIDLSAWQTIQASDPNRRRIDWALITTAVVVFLVPGSVGVAVGVQLQSQLFENPESILRAIINHLASSPVLAVLFVSGLVCAVLSTIDGLCLAVTQTLMWDLIFPKEIESSGQSSESSTEHLIFHARTLSAIVPALSVLLFAVLILRGLDIFTISFVVFSFQNCLLFPVLSLLFLAKSTRRLAGISFLLALLTESILLMAFFVTGNGSIVFWIPFSGLLVGAIPFGISLTTAGKAECFDA
jgi:Na+/proline symporter